MTRRVPMFIGAGLAIAILFLGVLPTRAYVAQRDSIAAEKAKLAVLERENSRLSKRVDELQTDAEIERLAREQYNLVKPGEEAYAILPGAEEPPRAADAPEPTTRRAAAQPGFWSRTWDRITFWD